MKICHVITRLIIGGAQENTLLSCRGLADKGHEVTLLSGPETGPEGSLWDETKSAAFQSVVIPSLRRAVHPIHDLQAYLALKKWFRLNRPEVVHTHSSKAGIIAREAAFRARVPIVVHTIHGMSFNRTQGGWTRRTYRWLERRAAKFTTMHVAVADAMIEQSLLARIAPRERFMTIRSGMDTSRYFKDSAVRTEVRRTWGLDDAHVVVGTVARLFKNKGYEQILDAMPAMIQARPNLRFVWIGDGPHREVYARRLAAAGFSKHVRFLGLIPPAEVARCLNGFDILLHASQWEGLPRAVVQGLLTEVPAVSFDNDGAPEIVIPGETGLLATLGDTMGLAEAVIRLANDERLRTRMGKEGRRRMVTAFDWRKMVEELDALYLRLREPNR